MRVFSGDKEGAIVCTELEYTKVSLLLLPCMPICELSEHSRIGFKVRSSIAFCLMGKHLSKASIWGPEPQNQSFGCEFGDSKKVYMLKLSIQVM